MSRYKWASAGEWLEQTIDDALLLPVDEAVQVLAGLVRTCASKLDNDAIQDLFQPEMASDGFFVDLDNLKCDECGEPFSVTDDGIATHDGEPGGIDHDTDMDHVPYCSEAEAVLP